MGKRFYEKFKHRFKNSEPRCDLLLSDKSSVYEDFFLLYHSYLEITPQVEEQLKNQPITQQVAEQLENIKITQQIVERIAKDIFSVPWGHHMLLIDKFKAEPKKALFFVHRQHSTAGAETRCSILLEQTFMSVRERL